MDRRTARAMSELLIVHHLMKERKIPETDISALMAVLSVTSKDIGVSIGVVASKLVSAPQQIIDDMQFVIDTVRKGVATMEADPAFVENFNKKAVEMLK